MRLADTHAHLDSAEFEGERDEVISRALAAGLAAIVTVGVDVESSRQAVALAQQHPGVHAATGIHPHEAAKAGPDALAELERLSLEPAVVAIGEIGLDFHYSFSTPNTQRELLLAQLELARRVNKPVIIHDREAHAETMAMLQHNAHGLRGVLHCFSGDRDMAAQAIRAGFYLSFAGPVTFQNARKLQALVRELPLDHMLLETDCPWLAPRPHRGLRNEPAYVRLVAAQVAALKELPLEQVAEVTTANASRLFGFAIP